MLDWEAHVPLIHSTFLCQDGKWGHVEADGKWSGKIAKVMTEDYDFIISDIFITYKRCKIFDASLAFDKVMAGFYKELIFIQILKIGVSAFTQNACRELITLTSPISLKLRNCWRFFLPDTNYNLLFMT